MGCALTLGAGSHQMQSSAFFCIKNTWTAEYIVYKNRNPASHHCLDAQNGLNNPKTNGLKPVTCIVKDE